MQSINSQLTEQDQQKFNRQLQEPNDEIGVHSDEEEDEEESDEDEYVCFYLIKNYHSNFCFFSSDDESEDDEAMDRSPRIRGNKLGI